MKTFTVLVVILIGVLVALAALSAPDSAYGKWPAAMAATTAASLLLLVYFAAYGWLRKDRYLLGAVLFVLLDAALKLARLPGHTNAFGLFWGIAIVLGGSGLTLLVFGVLRLACRAVWAHANPVPCRNNFTGKNDPRGELGRRDSTPPRPDLREPQ